MSYPVFPAAISGKGVGGDPWPDGGPLGCASGCSAAATTIFSGRCPEFTGALS